MIDDLKFIHSKDTQDSLGVAAGQGRQLIYEFATPVAVETPKNIVFCGMGGSALQAKILRSWLDLPVPLEIVQGYDIPTYVDDQTLVIASSHSGNTEETVSCLQQAIDRGAVIAVSTSGGKLQEIARQHDLPVVLLPSGSQPRYSVFYALGALVSILGSAGVIDAQLVRAELAATSAFIDEAAATWAADIPSANNPAKQLAKELAGKSAVVYGAEFMAPVAYMWKISLNENAKNVAWKGQYPEANHNEMIGWVAQPVDKPYEVIDLRSSYEHQRNIARMQLTDKMLSGRRPKAHVVNAQGESKLDQLLWAAAYGSFVSIYLALINGVNPTPVELMERFKKQL